MRFVDVTANNSVSAASSQRRLTWAEIAMYHRTGSGLPIRPHTDHEWPGLIMVCSACPSRS